MLSKLIEEKIKASSDSEKVLFSLLLQNASARTLVCNLLKSQQQIAQLGLNARARTLYNTCVECLRAGSLEAMQAGTVLVWQLRDILQKTDGFIECLKAMDATRARQLDFEQRVRTLVKCRNDELLAVQKQADLLNTFCTLFQKFRKAGLPLF